MHRRGGGKFRGGNRFNSANNQGHGQNQWSNDNNDWKISTNKNRRVSFKPSVRNSQYVDETKVRAILDDEDMTGESSTGVSQRLSGGSGGFSKYKMGLRGRRNGSPIPRRTGYRKLQPGQSGWFQVTIHHGHKYEKNLILKSLMDAITPTVFQPRYYKIDPENRLVTFYLDDYKAADQINNLDRTIQLPDGFKMNIRVRSSIPQVCVDATLKERMKLAMVKRYNPQTKAMDLTKFHNDTDLMDIFCALFRPTIMLCAIDIIAENIPDLEALNLNDNKIHHLDHMKNLGSRCPCIKVLHLASNRINSVSSLDALSQLPLVELVLEGNPLVDRIRDHTNYISEIRKKFPRLIKLDGSELSRPIGFDVEDETTAHVPDSKPVYLCNQGGSEIVQKFLEQYFCLYDSDNRQQLLDAYHENAMFSLTATYNQHINNDQKLTVYLSKSRSLLKTRDFEARFRSLKRGKLQVVSALADLPLTKHDPQSFAVDLQLFTPQMILLTVTGVFKERRLDKNAEYIRSFQRSLVIVPNNNGFCIKNEMYHINNANRMQERKAFKAIEPAIVQPNIVSPIAVQPQVQQPVLGTVGGAPDDNTKMQMVQAMSLQSNMNGDWSRKCLEESNWDFQHASYVFTELHKQNKIPPEAFMK